MGRRSYERQIVPISQPRWLLEDLGDNLLGYVPKPLGKSAVIGDFARLGDIAVGEILA